VQGTHHFERSGSYLGFVSLPQIGHASTWKIDNVRPNRSLFATLVSVPIEVLGCSPQQLRVVLQVANTDVATGAEQSAPAR
jgi:hypothetical protein